MYYCPSVPYRVISPQNLDKQLRANKLGTLSEHTSSEGTTLCWTTKKGVTHKKNIIHSDRSSVPMFLAKPSMRRYKAFCQRPANKGDESLLADVMSATYYSDNEWLQVYENTTDVPLEQQDETTAEEVLFDERGDLSPTVQARVSEGDTIREQPIMIDFHNTSEEEIGKTASSDDFSNLDAKSLKLLWHYRLGHLPFATINQLAKQGELPK
jgi:hypothetical protein